MLTFKDSKHVSSEDITVMQPALVIALGVFMQFCQSRALPCEITNIKTKFPVSKTNTHPEGRAFDASVRGWPEEFIKECENYMEKHIGYLGAISSDTFKPNLVYYHDAGLGPHFHIQVAREVYLKQDKH